MKEIIIYQSSLFSLSLFQLISSISAIAIAIVLVSVLNRLIRKYGERFHFSSKFIRFVRQGIRVLFFLATLTVVLEILNVDYHSFFNYTFYTTDKYTVKVKNFIIVIIIIYVTRLIVFATDYGMNRRMDQKRMDIGRGKSFLQILKYLIWVVGLSIIASTFGLNMTFIIASISALLIGVGFGLQHIFNDFFSGIIILFDGSVKVNDIVEVEGTIGRILTIGLRYSKVLTRNNVVIIVPNSRFTTEKVINWSHNKEATRFHVNVGVAYGSDVRLVEKILLDEANKHDQVVKTPKPFVRFNDFGESSLDFQLYFWTSNDFLVENTKSDLRFGIDAEFRRHKVEIPFPQRDLHLKSKHFD